MRWFKKIKNRTEELILDDNQRKRLIFEYLYWLMGIACTVMSIINIFTKQWGLLIATGSFVVICLISILLSRILENGSKISSTGISVALIIMFSYFAVSGGIEGFSIYWLILLPLGSVLLYGVKIGSRMSFVQLLLVLLFFYTPWFEKFGGYVYSDTIKMRFPFLYLSSFALAILLEYIRGTTYSKLAEVRTKLEYLSKHDALTGVYNRYGFNDEIDNSILDKKFSFLIIDIDSFKSINDSYGHLAGDFVLKKVANIIQENVCCESRVYRWGGEEFSIITVCNHDHIELANNINKIIRDEVFNYKGIEIKVTVSIGLIFVDKINSIGEMEKVINEADVCLYKAKKAGRNRVEYGYYNK